MDSDTDQREKRGGPPYTHAPSPPLLSDLPFSPSGRKKQQHALPKNFFGALRVPVVSFITQKKNAISLREGGRGSWATHPLFWGPTHPDLPLPPPICHPLQHSPDTDAQQATKPSKRSHVTLLLQAPEKK